MWGKFPDLERNPDDPEYKKAEPGSIQEFKGVSEDTPIFIPELDENRKCTDVPFLVIFALFVTSVIAFSIYFYIFAFNTQKIKEIIEKEIGMQRIKFYVITVGAMSGTALSTYSKIVQALEFLLEFFAILVLCYLIFFFLWYSTRWCFWCLIFLELGFGACATIAFWVALAKTKEFSFLVPAIVCTAFIVFLVILLLFFYDKFELIILIYEEAMEAIFTIKALLFLPMLSLLVVFVVNSPLLLFVTLAMAKAIDVGTVLTKVYISFTSFTILWILNFVYGSQCVIISGSVCNYYFTRDLEDLRRPCCSSLFTYIRFHLGTVAAGSLVIALTSFLKKLAEKAKEEAQNKAASVFFCVVAACLGCAKEAIIYCTQKAYIMTAMHGSTFCQSGKRSRRLIWSNLLDTVAIDGVGNIIFYGAGVLISIISIAVGVALNYVPVIKTGDVIHGMSFILMGLFCCSLIILYYLQVVLIAIGTIFLCFCEDKLCNDGSIDYPYFMSARLLEVVNIAFDLVEERRVSIDRRSVWRRSTIIPELPKRRTQYYPTEYPNEFRFRESERPDVRRLSRMTKRSRLSSVLPGSPY